MKSSIKHIELVFENLESIVLPIEQVKNLYVGGIKSYLLYQSHFEELVLSNVTSYECEHASIAIKFNQPSELEYDHEELGVLGMFINNDTINNTSERPEVLGRVVLNDISHIHFLDKDKKSALYLAVPWGEKEYHNDCMHVKVDKDRKILFIDFIKDTE